MKKNLTLVIVSLSLWSMQDADHQKAEIKSFLNPLAQTFTEAVLTEDNQEKMIITFEEKVYEHIIASFVKLGTILSNGRGAHLCVDLINASYKSQKMDFTLHAFNILLAPYRNKIQEIARIKDNSLAKAIVKEISEMNTLGEFLFHLYAQRNVNEELRNQAGIAMQEGQMLREGGGVNYVIVDQKNTQNSIVFFTARPYPSSKQTKKLTRAIESMIQHRTK